MSGEAGVDKGLRTAISIAILAMFAAFGWQMFDFLKGSWQAIRFFDELDYGEGIVWQQAADLFTHKSFGRIDGFPSIVYHYTPLYHAVTALCAQLAGTDMLATGRFVAIASTLLAGAMAGLIAAQAMEKGSMPARSAVVAAVALSIACLFPVTLWAPLMRVDMLAVALDMTGVLLAILALRHPRLIHAAALAFVAAIYTKQTSIAAPAAVFLVMLWLRPRLAWAGIATATLSGLAVLGTLMALTEGRFANHVFLYNINRFDATRLIWILQQLQLHLLIFAAAILGFAMRAKAIGSARKTVQSSTRKEWLLSHPADAAFVIAAAYFVTAALMTLTVAKSGSSINYFIEWLVALTILAGIALIEPVRISLDRENTGRLRPALAVGIPTLLAAHAIFFNPYHWDFVWRPSRVTELHELAARVRAAPKPIISDNMVILRANRKDVVWEPAIFAELAHTGAYDEKPFVERINRQEFAFFITVGRRGQRLFDSRYNPAVADAMDVHYPVIEKQAGYLVHLPADVSPARAGPAAVTATH